MAYKDDHGLDYYENSTTFQRDEKAELPESIALQLSGATSARLKIVDTDNRPVPDVGVGLWSVETQGKRSYINLSSMTLGVTDASGVAEFRFILHSSGLGTSSGQSIF